MSKRKEGGTPSGAIRQWIGRTALHLWGWKIVGGAPDAKKFIIVGAPHTSNWDFPLTMLSIYAFGLKISWMGKDSLFKPPLGWIMKSLGGIAIKRDKQYGVVEQMAERFRNADTLVVAVAASGTRKKVEHWKSGFYWIAHAAQVPIVCGAVDYAKKEAHLGLSFIPTGDVKKDMDRIREFYKGKQGKRPELQTPIKLADEGAD